MKNISDNQVSANDVESLTNEGYLLFANETSSGRPWCWGSPDLEYAKALAKTICEQTGQVVRISKLIGVVQPIKPPTQYIEAKEPPNNPAKT